VLADAAPPPLVPRSGGPAQQTLALASNQKEQ
jgi:hypothetical protein